MGIFRRKKEKRAEGLVETEGSLLSALLGGGGLITKKEAMEIPAVSSCINLIADRLAVLPIKLYKRSGKKPEEVRNDKRVNLLNYDTGDTLNATEMRKRWVRDYFLGKGAYTYIERNSFGEIIGLYYVDENNVSACSNRSAHSLHQRSYRGAEKVTEKLSCTDNRLHRSYGADGGDIFRLCGNSRLSY